jgi:hypothetical protein
MGNHSHLLVAVRVSYCPALVLAKHRSLPRLCGLPGMTVGRRRLGDLVCATLLLVVVAAPAEAMAMRVGVARFEGANEAPIRKRVMQVLKAHGFELVRSRDVQEELDRNGGSLDSEQGRENLAKELALSAIVTGKISNKRADIAVHNGSDGSTMGDAIFSGANPHKLAAEVGRGFWRRLGGKVQLGRVPANARKAQKASQAESPEDNEESPEVGEAASGEDDKAKPSEAAVDEIPPQADTDESRKRGKIRMENEAEPAGGRPLDASTVPPWLDVEIGGGGYHRELSYRQNISTNVLLPYSLALGPVAVADGVIYPFQHLVGGYVGNLGVEGSIQQGILISSQGVGSNKYSDLVHDFAGGLRFRFILGGGDTDLHISVSYGEDAFTFSGTQRSTLQIPDTIYRYVRPALGLNVPLGQTAFSLRMAGGYRYVTNRGGPQISGDPGFFPHLTVAGADAEIQGAYSLNGFVEIRAGVEVRRYWYNMHSVPSDLGNMGSGYAAGGAIDQSFTFTATIAFLLGGQKTDGGVSTAAPPAAPPPTKGSLGSQTAPEDRDDDTDGGN